MAEGTERSPVVSGDDKCSEEMRLGEASRVVRQGGRGRLLERNGILVEISVMG